MSKSSLHKNRFYRLPRRAVIEVLGQGSYALSDDKAVISDSEVGAYALLKKSIAQALCVSPELVRFSPRLIESEHLLCDKNKKEIRLGDRILFVDGETHREGTVTGIFENRVVTLDKTTAIDIDQDNEDCVTILHSIEEDYR